MPDKKQVLFTLMLPGPYDKLDEQLQEGIEGFEAQWLDMEVTQKVDFEPQDKDGNDWLMSAAWKEDQRTLQVEPNTIFKERRWDMAKRVVDYRKHLYWRQEFKPTNNADYLSWCRGQIKQLGGVEVRFMALVTPHPLDAGRGV